jgi:hypothetical protein
MHSKQTPPGCATNPWTRHEHTLHARAGMGQELDHGEVGLSAAAPSLRSWGPVKHLPRLPVGRGNLDVEADHHRHVFAPR